MRRPSFQFYPADWLGNTNLRRCSHAEKGLWVDVMCLMHDADEYGVLRWPLKDIAAAVGCRPADLKGLVLKGVLKGDDVRLDAAFVYVPRTGRKDGKPVELVEVQDGPIWYSSRMVRDEYVRQHRGEASRFTPADGQAPEHSPKAAPKAAPMPPFGDGSSSSSSSSSSNTPKPPSGAEVRFARFWSAYPKKAGKKPALKAFAKLNPDDALLELMLRAIESQKRSDKWQRGFILDAVNWINGERWMDESASVVQASVEWVQRAGFDNKWEAENAGCFEHNAHEFHDGRRLEVHE